MADPEGNEFCSDPRLTVRRSRCGTGLVSTHARPVGRRIRRTPPPATAGAPIGVRHHRLEPGRGGVHDRTRRGGRIARAHRVRHRLRHRGVRLVRGGLARPPGACGGSRGSHPTGAPPRRLRVPGSRGGLGDGVDPRAGPGPRCRRVRDRHRLPGGDRYRDVHARVRQATHRHLARVGAASFRGHVDVPRRHPVHPHPDRSRPERALRVDVGRSRRGADRRGGRRVRGAHEPEGSCRTGLIDSAVRSPIGIPCITREASR